jgi:WD40 repeat protein
MAEHLRVTYRGDASMPCFSPDGKWLAYVAGKTIVVRDIATGAERNVYEGRALVEVQWFPDGERIRFLDWNEGRLVVHVVSKDGGAVRDEEYRGLRRYSPVGGEVAEFRPDGKELRVFDSGTGAPKAPLRLTGEFSYLVEVRWSPSGRWLLVATTNNNATYAFWAVRRDGAVQRRLFEDDLAFDFVAGSEFSTVQWSPREDAFYYFRDGATGTRELVKAAFEPRTGEARDDRTVLLAGLEVTYDLSVAPDGRRLAYARRKFHTSLWVVALEGPDQAPVAKATKLEAGITAQRAISVAPDGERIAYAQFEGNVHIVTRALGGGAPKRLSLPEGVRDVESTAWSPDGAEIAFIALMRNGDSKLYKVSLGGGEARALGAVPVGQQVRWSPGRPILYQTQSHQNFRVLDPVSLQETSLFSQETGWISDPCTSRQGEQVVVYRGGGGKPIGLWGISRTDGSSRLLAPDLRPLGFSADERTIYARRHTDIRDLYLVPSHGGAPVRSVALPLEKPVDAIALVPGSRRFVCAITDADSDIWFVESFDPAP